jgi:uncharacterized damage-inducible protein DinB
MNARAEIIAQGIESCKPLLARYLTGMSEEHTTVSPPGLPNHPAWTLGHLALTMHRVAERFDGQPLPTETFGTSPGQINPDLVSFASTPVDDAALYPTLPRALDAYNAACDRLAVAVRAADDATLDKPTPWGNTTTTLGLLAMRMIFHNGIHTGQLADLRRALGMKSIFA